MNKQSIALSIIRIAVAGNMLIHGIARIVIDGVNPFDTFLSSLGFPAYTAWIITFFEILAAISVIVNRWVVPLSILFCLELLTGIFLVHMQSGWFVVGAGGNGMEYSVLLILGFVATIVANLKTKSVQ
ncbi:MAG: DoxX family protein [Cyclobacteriaceae bacterium]